MNKTITLLIIVLLGGCSYGKRIEQLEANQKLITQDIISIGNAHNALVKELEKEFPGKKVK